MAKKRSPGKNPYILIVGLLALMSALWGRQIQTWVMSLPTQYQGLPFLVAFIVIGVAFATIALNSQRDSDV
jgi:hypothetical protein